MTGNVREFETPFPLETGDLWKTLPPGFVGLHAAAVLMTGGYSPEAMYLAWFYIDAAAASGEIKSVGGGRGHPLHVSIFDLPRLKQEFDRSVDPLLSEDDHATRAIEAASIIASLHGLADSYQSVVKRHGAVSSPAVSWGPSILAKRKISELQCGRWLVDLASQGDASEVIRSQTKKEWREAWSRECLKSGLDGLSPKAFGRAWDAAALRFPIIGKAGRKNKTP